VISDPNYILIVNQRSSGGLRSSKVTQVEVLIAFSSILTVVFSFLNFTPFILIACFLSFNPRLFFSLNSLSPTFHLSTHDSIFLFLSRRYFGHFILDWIFFLFFLCYSACNLYVVQFDHLSHIKTTPEAFFHSNLVSITCFSSSQAMMDV
jgi:hypothetical protein